MDYDQLTHQDVCEWGWHISHWLVGISVVSALYQILISMILLNGDLLANVVLTCMFTWPSVVMIGCFVYLLLIFEAGKPDALRRAGQIFIVSIVCLGMNLLSWLEMVSFVGMLNQFTGIFNVDLRLIMIGPVLVGFLIIILIVRHRIDKMSHEVLVHGQS